MGVMALGCGAAPGGAADATSSGPGTTTGSSLPSTSADATVTGEGSSGPSTSADSTGVASAGTTATDTETDSTGEPGVPTVELRLITDQNRAHPRMYGGWGPHLRGVMRDAEGTQWFCADAGPSVLDNASILYFRRDGDRWSQVAQQPHLPGVQQNSASVLSGSTISTYSVNVATSTLEECNLDTQDLSSFACNTISIGGPYSTPPQSNYVGAALDPNGARVVWFTTVGGAGSGQFTYTYDFGGGWNGPIAWTLPGYNTFEYVRASFGAPNTVTWHGQLLLGAFPGGTFDPAIAETTLGQTPTLTPLGGDAPPLDVRTGADIWVDPQTGDQHAVAQATGSLAYYYRPGADSWANHTQPLHWFEDTFRARFVAPAAGGLALVRGSASGRSGVDVWIVDTVTGSIDWNAATVAEVPTAGVIGLSRPSGIYVEGATYQSVPVEGIEFALCGAYQESDEQLWHGSVVMR